MSNAIELQETLSEDASISETVLEPPHEEFESLSKSDAWMLYASHASSTWNARSYEFAAVRRMTNLMLDEV